MYTPYDVYKTFKTVEAEVKGKNLKLLSEDKYDKRLSSDNKDILQKTADLFSTRFSKVDMAEYIRCGFHHFKSFGYNKMFREIVLQEYISRDSRIKRNPTENLKQVLDSLKVIDKPINVYLNETVNGEKRILHDYMLNNIGCTVVVWCIWRNLWVPTDIEWEYLNVIKNNFAEFEKNVIKWTPLLDQWRRKIKTKQ